jgi:thiol-disulfide isomerase/thioredoxin
MTMAKTTPKGPSTAMLIITILSLVLGGSTMGLVAQRGAELKALEKEQEKGPVALDFELVSVDGKVLRLSDLKGKPVLLDLMATWCSACRQEMPLLNATYNAHKDQIYFLSIGMDWFENDTQLRAFRDQYKVQWTFALDRAGAVYGAFYASNYPTTILLDKDQRIVFRYEGEISQQDLDAALAKVI